MKDFIAESIEQGRIFHQFVFKDKIELLLDKTDFSYHPIKLPFPNIKLNLDYSDEYAKFTHLYAWEKGQIILITYARQFDGWCDIGVIPLKKWNEKEAFEKGRVQIDGTIEEQEKEYEKHCQIMGVDPTIEHKLSLDGEQKMIRFVGNFLNLLNSDEVETILIEKENLKRISRGKNPISKIVFVRLKDKIKKYLNKLKSENSFEYNHSFWVRGHWRTFRNEKFKQNVGKIIWILPFIKGDGILVKKDYVVENNGI